MQNSLHAQLFKQLIVMHIGSSFGLRLSTDSESASVWNRLLSAEVKGVPQNLTNLNYLYDENNKYNKKTLMFQYHALWNFYDIG